MLGGGSGKGRGGILLVKSRRGSNSQGREEETPARVMAGQLRSVHGAQNSPVWLKHSHGGWAGGQGTPSDAPSHRAGARGRCEEGTDASPTPEGIGKGTV